MTRTINTVGYYPLFLHSFHQADKYGATTAGPFNIQTTITVDLGQVTGEFEELSAGAEHINKCSYKDLFYGCHNLTTVTNMNSSINAMQETFYNCSNLTNVSALPPSLVNMCMTFYNCSNLTTIPNIPNSVIDMAAAFAGTGITTAPSIPNSVQNLHLVFNNCTNLNISTISLPSNPNLYAAQIFNSTPTFNDLAKIDISKATSLGGFFRQCSDLPNVINQNFWNTLNINQSNILNLYHIFCNCPTITDVTYIPNNVQNITSAFSQCTNLINANSLVISNKITSLANTFAGCTNLTNPPIIPNSVTNLSHTFDSCLRLVNAPTIPDSVVNLDYTFSDCMDLDIQTVHIPNGVTALTGTFSAETNITNINNLVIPNSVTSLNNTFGMTNISTLSTIHIPNSVTDISSAFVICPQLTTINANELPSSIINMSNAFAGSALTTIASNALPTNVVDLSQTFSACKYLTNLATLIIPNSVTNMVNTFVNCSNLTTAPNIPSNVTDMADTFYGCIKLAGDIYIHSPNIIRATSAFYQTNQNIVKNVYIPFKYANNQYTKTYNSFIAAGYKETSTLYNVYLKDLTLK